MNNLNSNIPCISWLCEICENCCFLVKELNKQRKKVLWSFPTNSHGISETQPAATQSLLVLMTCPTILL